MTMTERHGSSTTARSGRIPPGWAGVLLAVLLAMAGATAVYFSSGHGPSNILLITLDTTRADRLGCYGYGGDTSPYLDRLAREGVVFDLAIAQAAVTPVSHASILTGLNPYQHGVRVIHGKAGYFLSPEHPTLASVLKENGFSTAAFVSAFPVSGYYGFDHAFDVFDTGLDGGDAEEVGLDDTGHFNIKIDRTQRRADVTTSEAIDWLKGNDSPFFLWMHYFDPHDPVLMPPKKIVERFAKDIPPSYAWKRSVYDAEVNFMDQEIGRLFRALKDLGRYEDTVIVVVGDHGEGLGDHDWWHHRVLYQEQIRLPLIIRLPGEPGKKRVKDLVRSIDIFPTVLEWLGLPLPERMEGKSLLELMRGGREPPRFAYADAINLLDNNLGTGIKESHRDLMYSVTDGTWKLIFHQFNPENSELYNLQEDPGELENVIELHPGQHKRLMKLFEQTGGRIDRLIEAAPANEEALKKLRELGYGGF